MKFIDPHIHLFDRDKGDYQWLRADNAPYWPDKSIIDRNFKEDNLTVDNQMQQSGLVHIEAGFDNVKPWLEIEWVEQQVTGPLRTIGSADLTLAPDEFKQLIERYQKYESTVGVRHIFDDDAVAIVEHANTLTNLKRLAAVDLIFETQIDGNDDAAVNTLIKLCSVVPNLVIILSHCCFAPYTTSTQTKWQNNVKRLSQCPTLSIKASGWEMVNRDYDEKYIERTLQYLLSTFGEDRVMLASNFPLTLFSQPYDSLWQKYRELPFDHYVLEKLMHGNAIMLYQF